MVTWTQTVGGRQVSRCRCLRSRCVCFHFLSSSLLLLMVTWTQTVSDGSAKGWEPQAHDKRRQYPHAANQVAAPS